MKVCLIQPPYSRDAEKGAECFLRELDMLRSVGADGEDCGVIVLPEYSDVLFAAADRDEVIRTHERDFPRLIEACREAALRCSAAVFFNALDFADSAAGRNTTFVMDKTGAIVGKYAKRHLPPLEREKLALDPSAALTAEPPLIVTVGGVRYAFLTCYDFYFYEAFPMIARERPDVIIGCSLQRSDRHTASEILCRHLAYSTNAYVLRCSVSMEGAEEGVCGASMAVAPDGTVLSSLGGECGIVRAEFDPREKYYKPAGFGRAPAAHWEYAEYGRNPQQYRPAGAAVVPSDARMPYPRICAHRGFNTVAPENSMPAFGAAVAMGAEEIEFDLWETADGEIVSIHDADLDRVSTGHGYVWDHTYEELLAYDFGVKTGAAYEGMKILRFEEILKKLSRLTVMNVHVKSRDEMKVQGITRGDADPLPEAYLRKMIGLIRRYDAAEHCYFMSGNAALLRQLRALAPDIGRCAGADGDVHGDLVEKALAYGCAKIQLFSPYFAHNPPDYAKRQIEKAHEHGIRVNLFCSDRAEEAAAYFRMGADTILTNDYNRVSKAKEIK